MYVLLITAGGCVMRALGDPDVFAGWRWTPAPHMQIFLRTPGPLVTIDATDGPYGGPEYPTGGPQ